MRATASTMVVATVMLLVGCAEAQGESRTVYVSDVLSDLLLFHMQGFGNLGLDTCAWVPERPKLALRVRDREYAKGLGHHANGEIALMLEGRYATFEAEVGVQWEHGDTGSVVFRVFVDDELRFDSGVVREADEPKPVRVLVKGAQVLRLVVTDAGDGITCDCADWLDARLTVEPEAKARETNSVDVAPFGIVATWDPQRIDGTRAGRVDEFPAEDVFLHTELAPERDGSCVLPVHSGGTGCIGLQWVERRLVKELGLQFQSAAPSPEGVEVQYWLGESVWQGKWERLPGELTAEAGAWLFRANWRQASGALARNTQKVRWLLPNAAEGTRVRLQAYTRAIWDTVDLRVEAREATGGSPAEVEVYNGELLDAGDAHSCAWDMTKPLRLRVRSSRPMPIKSDRTVVRFRPSSGSPAKESERALRPTGDTQGFAVAVEDMLANGCVWVPEAGVFVTTAGSGQDLRGHLREVEGRTTVLDDVRAAPDQTFAQALSKVHREIQNHGPMLLSLACDNHKFQVNRDGAIEFSTEPDVAHHGAIRYPVELRPTFGSGRNAGLTRHLQGGWLPIPVIAVEEAGVRYRQRTFVAPYPGKGPKASVCVADFTVENLGGKPARAALSLAALADRFSGVSAAVMAVSDGFVAHQADRLLGYLDTRESGGLAAEVGEGMVAFAGDLPPRGHARVIAYMPTWAMRPDECGLLKGGAGLVSGVEAYWHRVLAGATGLDIPDPLLSDVVRASQVHCLIAARTEADRERIAPWISSDRYGPLESEANSIILGMGLLGHDDFAQRSLDFFVKRYNAAGYLTTGYTVMGTGWHLWTLAEHYRLTRDEAWLRQAAPEIARVCRWIVEQRKKTMQLRPNGERVPEYGLMPPGVVADWGMYANRFFGEAHFCAGLRDAATVLAESGYPGAEELQQEAEAYRQDILRAYAWAQERTPVRPLRDGTWVPACPAMMQCFGKVGESFPGEDWGRTWAGDVEIGPQHLVALGLMDPTAPDAEWMMEFLEDYWCLQSGMGEYPAEESRADPLNLGGFSKVQPYYTRMTDVYALRDEVKPFIRSYLNAIPSLLSLENLSLWEHFHNGAGWNKTHETGWLLQQTRTMLLTERGEELWLAPFVPNHWLKDGRSVGVSRAPTCFGEVSYSIRSHVEQGFIEARIEPPKRSAPSEIVLRVRHPEGKRMQSVTVNGEPHADFDAKREVIRLAPSSETLSLRAIY